MKIKQLRKVKYIITIACFSIAIMGCNNKELKNIATEEIDASEKSITSTSTVKTSNPIEDSINISLMPKSLEEVLEMSNARRRKITKPVLADRKFIEEWSNKEIGRFRHHDSVDEFSLTHIYTIEQIEEDMDIMFDSFKNVYGPYYYFGGDDIFSSAKKNILNECKGEKITGSLLEEILLKNLDFIYDNHFALNKNKLHKGKIPYIGKQIIFDLYEDGFVNAENQKHIIKIDNNENFSENIKLSLDHNGNLVYKYITLSDVELKSCILSYSDGTSEMMKMSKFDSYYTKPTSSSDVELEYINDIPIIRIRSMGFDHEEEDRGANLFLEYAQKLKNEPILIVDLRHHAGGNGILPMKWMEIYTGEFVPTNFYSLKRPTIVTFFGLPENPGYVTPQLEREYFLKSKRISDEWEIELADEDKITNNDRLLILLTNTDTYSAGEKFIDLAFNIENTLIVGSNTAGCLRSGLTLNFLLPNTGIKVSFGNYINIFPENNYFEEFIGFQPDIWVSGNEEKAVLKWIEKNKVKIDRN